MPPKRKIGRPSKAAQSPAVAVSPQASAKVVSSFDDVWTDEQETALFKSMIACKPVGLHKHFRMIHIYEYLRRHGHTSAEMEHTKILGIWNKLRSLYNLEALDEREISFGDASLTDIDGTGDSYYEFDVPDDPSFEEIKRQRRLKPEGSKSPPLLSRRPSVDSTAANQRPSTVEDSEDPRSSPVPTRDTRSRRSARGTRGNRKSQLHEVSNNIPEKRRTSKASIEEDPEDNESGEKEVEPPEEHEDDDKAVDISSSKQANTRSARRRSGRRR